MTVGNTVPCAKSLLYVISVLLTVKMHLSRALLLDHTLDHLGLPPPHMLPTLLSCDGFQFPFADFLR